MAGVKSIREVASDNSGEKLEAIRAILDERLDYQQPALTESCYPGGMSSTPGDWAVVNPRR